MRNVITATSKLTVSELASFISALISTFPGNQFVPLYRVMLKFKGKSLKYNKGILRATQEITLSKDTFHPLSASVVLIQKPEIDLYMRTTLTLNELNITVEKD